MPLARIVTWLAEDTDALAKDLRARGFEVVTKSPDEISSELADLEITVEECAPEEALTSASGIAREQNKCVFIAPGAITDNLRPVSVVPLIREPELAYRPTQSIERDEVEQLAAIHQLEDRPEALDQISVIQAEPVLDLSAAVAQPEAETISHSQLVAPLAEKLAEPVAEVVEPLVEVSEPLVEVTEALAEQEVFASEKEEELVAYEFSASVESLPTPISEPVLEAPLAVAEIDPGEYSETQPETIVEVSAFVQAEAVSLVETDAISNVQPETIVEAPAVLDVEEVWLVETDAISEIQPEAVVETSAALRADVSLIDTEPTSDWPIWHPLAEAEIPAQDSLVPEALVKEPALAVPLTSRSKIAFREQGPQVVPLMQNAVPVRPNTYRQRLLQKAIVQNDEVFWKTATALAMVAVAALLVGASANRFSPLPANVVQRSIEAQQPVPFEKARIVPALPLDAGNKIGALPSAQGSDVARFHPALAIEPAAPRIVPETADRANDRLLRTKPRHHSAGHLESDMVAEDTVVRYDKKHPPASHTQAQKNPGVKQYSDLD
ncbi:MAG: hypothetical protein AUH15_04125 [Acidobacteriales bacterium 13_2_20CM_55_8]|nr:MAG: hypothetical protein AUH15_04125 [Acidobacteriales bacterium 13_2_20CM_55_8]